MRFQPVILGERELTLRKEVRAFLAEVGPDRFRRGLGMHGEHAPEFSRELAERGWVGMTIPEKYSGRPERSVIERFVVTEELLAAGAPLVAHWVSERQTAPMLVRMGTELQRERFLPAIARGECFFSIGMSEPDAGSDLAGVRTRATPAPGGWRLSGTKIWTTYAHLNHFFVALCRTSPRADDRHVGLSQLIVDLSSPGVTARPIRSIDGHDSFSEVILDEVFVPDEMVLGEIGQGWKQVTSELAFERSGPDRFLSTFGVVEMYLREHGRRTCDPHVAETVGRIVARLFTVRQMSLATVRLLERGEQPNVEAAITKDLGTTLEQEIVELIQDLVGIDPDPGSPSVFQQMLAEAVLAAPSFTIRGGTTEILRIVTSRALRTR